MTEFVEIQTYGWIFDLVVAAIVVMAFAFLWRHVEKKSLLIAGSLPFILLVVYFMTEKLETRIDASGIHYKMFPAQLTEKNIAWFEVANIYVSDYIVYSRAASRYDVYTIGNKYGIYIILRNAKPIIIGTKRPEEVNNIIRENISKAN